MKFKNLEELKKFIETQPQVKTDFASSEGLEKQFRNRISNNACIHYAVYNVDKTWTLEKFYCDKNGTAITAEKFELDKGI